MKSLNQHTDLLLTAEEFNAMEKFTSKKTIMTKALKADGEKVSGIMLYYDEATDTKYFYTGEGHICILGVPGSGKSSTMSINYAKTIIEKEESGIFVDSKTSSVKIFFWKFDFANGLETDSLRTFCSLAVVLKIRWLH